MDFELTSGEHQSNFNHILPCFVKKLIYESDGLCRGMFHAPCIPRGQQNPVVGAQKLCTKRMSAQVGKVFVLGYNCAKGAAGHIPLIKLHHPQQYI